MYVHPVKPVDEFKMKETRIYKNFDPVRKNELLAYDKNGEVKSPYTGMILMPLYQEQGEDGFFIIREITPRKNNLNGKKTAMSLMF